MTNITDLIPEDAITVADTAEYTAWKSQDGSEAWISMKEPNTFVTDGILTSVVERVYLAGGRTEKVTVPDSRGLNGSIKPKIRKCFFALDLYVSDFGTFDVIDLKRNEIDALAEPFIANLKDGIEALGKLFEESGFENDAGEFLLERACQRFAWEKAFARKDAIDKLSQLLRVQYQALEAGNPAVTKDTVYRTLEKLNEAYGFKLDKPIFVNPANSA